MMARKIILFGIDINDKRCWNMFGCCSKGLYIDGVNKGITSGKQKQ